jgi:hypothetical protein
MTSEEYQINKIREMEIDKHTAERAIASILRSFESKHRMRVCGMSVDHLHNIGLTDSIENITLSIRNW